MSETAPEIELGLSRVTKLTSVVSRSIAEDGSVRGEGEYFVAKEPNAFGMSAVVSCPGMTEFCQQDCYAIYSEQRNATALKMRSNYDALHGAEGVEAKTTLLSAMIGEYRTQADRLGVDSHERRFRIHWDGDFFSVEYAQSWRQVIEANPDISFWAYTRSFQTEVNVVPVLAGIDNLDLFLSVDAQNVDHAKKALEGYDRVKVAYLVEYEEDAQVLIEKLGREEQHRTLACPENMINEHGNHKLPVISEKGGACARCTYCVGKTDRAWDVIFVKTGKKHRDQLQLPEMPVSIRPRKERVEVIGAGAAQLVLEVDELRLF